MKCDFVDCEEPAIYIHRRFTGTHDYYYCAGHHCPHGCELIERAK